MARFLLPLIFSFTIACSALAQDKVLFMNGREMDCKLVSDTSFELVVELIKRNGKTKVKSIPKSDVFSYTPANSSEIVLYVQDSVFGDIYPEDAMRVYMMGSNDARSNFKAHHIAIIGFIACGTITLLGGDGLLTTFAPPFVYTFLQFAGKVKIREKYMSDKRAKYNDFYADGFEPPARSKKLYKALLGGFGGSGAAILFYFIQN
jgi:hypothetical protein